MKEPKLLLVGPPDSGKTSWFCPFEGVNDAILYEFAFFISVSNCVSHMHMSSFFCTNLFSGIIPSRFIAGVVRDGRFSGHLINGSTQIVFMDEWTNDSLCCEDAKRILQGNDTCIYLLHIYTYLFFLFLPPCLLLAKESFSVLNILAIIPSRIIAGAVSCMDVWL